MDQVRRKRIRLPASNYEAGWYFVTIRTDHRMNFLANVTPTVGADDSVRPCMEKSRAVEDAGPYTI